MQLWETSDKYDGFSSDGCSLHIDKKNCNDFISKFREIKDDVPDFYEKEIGLPFSVFVSDVLYSKIIEDNIRLSQHELNNLILLGDITLKND